MTNEKELTKSAERKIFSNAPDSNQFVLSDGRRLANVFELIEVLDDISSDVFTAHVNETKNDFSKWIGDVFEDKELAEKISSENSIVSTQITLLNYLVRQLANR